MNHTPIEATFDIFRQKFIKDEVALAINSDGKDVRDTKELRIKCTKTRRTTSSSGIVCPTARDKTASNISEISLKPRKFCARWYVKTDRIPFEARRGV